MSRVKGLFIVRIFGGVVGHRRGKIGALNLGTGGLHQLRRVDAVREEIGELKSQLLRLLGDQRGIFIFARRGIKHLGAAVVDRRKLRAELHVTCLIRLRVDNLAAQPLKFIGEILQDALRIKVVYAGDRRHLFDSKFLKGKVSHRAPLVGVGE